MNGRLNEKPGLFGYGQQVYRFRTSCSSLLSLFHWCWDSCVLDCFWVM